jgi:hypothetical protein
MGDRGWIVGHGLGVAAYSRDVCAGEVSPRGVRALHLHDDEIITQVTIGHTPS